MKPDITPADPVDRVDLIRRLLVIAPLLLLYGVWLVSLARDLVVVLAQRVFAP